MEVFWHARLFASCYWSSVHHHVQYEHCAVHAYLMLQQLLTCGEVVGAQIAQTDVKNMYF